MKIKVKILVTTKSMQDDENQWIMMKFYYYNHLRQPRIKALLTIVITIQAFAIIQRSKASNST